MWHRPQGTKIYSVRKLANARVRNFYAYENFCNYSTPNHVESHAFQAWGRPLTRPPNRDHYTRPYAQQINRSRSYALLVSEMHNLTLVTFLHILVEHRSSTQPEQYMTTRNSEQRTNCCSYPNVLILSKDTNTCRSSRLKSLDAYPKKAWVSRPKHHVQ